MMIFLRPAVNDSSWCDPLFLVPPSNLVGALYSVWFGCILRAYRSTYKVFMRCSNDSFEPLTAQQLARYPYLARITHENWLFMRSMYSLQSIFESADQLANEGFNHDQISGKNCKRQGS